MSRARAVKSLLVALALASCLVPRAWAQSEEMARLAESKKAFPEDEAALQLGEDVYRKRCAFCHGDSGEGDGGAAPYLDPRPRDFTAGLFKFRSTQTGELPTDEDLYRTIARGAPGTAMPAWGEPLFMLPEVELWAVTYYLKKISTEDFEDPDFNPYDYLLELPPAPACTAELKEEGKVFYEDETKGGCVKCHGVEGRGDGKEAGTHRDDWGDPLLPADLSRPWTLRNGPEPADLFRSLSSGFNGTPMAGFGETLSVEQRWSVVCYLSSLMVHPGTGQVVLTAAKVEGEIPLDPAAPFWSEQPALDVKLSGQLVVTPRLPIPAIDLVTVRAAYDEHGLAFHFTWNDRFENVSAPAEGLWLPELEEPDVFIPAQEVWGRRGGIYRDRLQIQFPVKPSDGSEKPFFYLGGPAAPVHLWTWNADRPEGRLAVERLARGSRSEPATQPEESQALTGQAIFENGQWRVVLKRPRWTEDPGSDTQFEEDRLIPFAVQAWEGGNGEEGLLGAISSWYYVVLVGRTDPRGYLWGFLATALTAVAMAACVRRARAVDPSQQEDEAEELSSSRSNDERRDS